MILGTASTPQTRSVIVIDLHGKRSTSYHTDIVGTVAECAARHREIIMRNYPSARIVSQTTRRVGVR